ncbi:chemotaxis protein CheB [Alkalitalea saponilacus]|uniref:protein-glutamate O-methyltransferase n=1 Tax=Alkalitalea saponilacus TaxID=889453 RepID=A0A1T5G8N4_9BACT|nr:chemotaxis protein CheB [Alkalitalea saponilacus]ASB47890.1 chemotaxis protein CheB [Alkalitalea saponilacus]SKC04734.1 two-component system, chemotaxis family, CheB/CheR fusion protein [Alkalitalea saponilacus]
MRAKKSKQTIKSKTTDSKSGKFLIVGIGASAGGLEALELFLKNVPEKSGMAYVIVQHLDPTQKGMLPELLQRISKIQVFQVQDLMKVKPDCVYVIPPNKSISILKGVLHLFEPVEARGLRLPIDFFLRSLADDQNEYAIGIILSGMGSDGSIGIRSIKGKNGIVMVQDPETARFDSMPRNAINSGLVDIIAPPAKLPSELIEYLKHIPLVKTNLSTEVKDKSAFEKIIILLRTHTGNDFSLYKKNTVYRRIERRMGIHKMDSISTYVHFLQENPEEIQILFKELMIGVTNFFRDSAVWEKLKEKELPSLIENLKPNTQLRAWIPGCSTGEEAYSLAIIFKEIQEKVYPNSGLSLQIFASDIDNDAIDFARKGVFAENIAPDVSPKRLNRYFIKTEEGYRVSSEIREMIVFAQHNIIMHPPFTNIDFISCRNLLIYLDTELQRKLIGLFYYSLNQNGIMVLGTSETLGLQSHLFSTVNSSLKIFKRSEVNHNPLNLNFPSSFTRPGIGNIENNLPDKPIMNIQTLADQLLLNQFSPSGVLVNENGDILYISGRTGKYLEPAVGKANLNIFAMLRPGFQSDFAIAFRKAVTNKETVVLHHVVIGTNGGSLTLNVTIQWIHKPEPLYGKLIIIFTDVPKTANEKPLKKQGRKSPATAREAKLEEELQHTREGMQNITEEMQTSQEELKSTNEELQSTNEELQSTNEELMTSKEEMQSLNEELQTVNAELMAKVDDYSRVNNDMKNLLNSIDIATLFLDKELNIRRYTNQATKIFKLIKSDIGRPFTDQVSQLIYPELPEDALEVLRTLIFIEKQIPTKNGRWFSIRIMPYRTFDDRIDGLVITFIDITEMKLVEDKLLKMNQENRLLIDSSSMVILKISANWTILEFNTAAETFFGKKREEVTGSNFMKLFISESLQKQVEDKMTHLITKKGDADFKMKVIADGNKEINTTWSINVLFNCLELSSAIITITKNEQS